MVRSVVPLVEEMLLLADEAMFLDIIALLRVRKAMPIANGLTFSTRIALLPRSWRLEIMCPSVRPIERAMREQRMDPQSTVFPAQPCRP